MQDVVYVGSSDFRGLSRADLGVMGVDHKDEEFPKGKPVEVSEELAKVLLNDEGWVAGEFVTKADYDKSREGLEVERAWDYRIGPDVSSLVANPGEQVLDPEDTNENKGEGEEPLGDAQTEGSPDSGGKTSGKSSASGAKAASAKASTGKAGAAS